LEQDLKIRSGKLEAGFIPFRRSRRRNNFLTFL